MTITIILTTQIFTWIGQCVTFSYLESYHLKWPFVIGQSKNMIELLTERSRGGCLDVREQRKFGISHCHLNIACQKRAGKQETNMTLENTGLGKHAFLSLSNLSFSASSTENQANVFDYKGRVKGLS